MDIRLALMTGVDIPIEECQLTVHQPTIKEIALIGEEDFFTGSQYLCLNKDNLISDKTLSSQTTNFEIFMIIMNEEESKPKKQAVKKVLQLLTSDYQIVFTPQSILFRRDGENLILDGNNFDSFQHIIKQIFCAKDDDSMNFNPVNDKAREIAEKIKKGRQRVAAQKAQGGSVIAQYLSTLAIGLHQNLLDLINLTLYQMYDLLERFQLYTSWDIDIRSRMAGAKADKPLDNWMKNIH